MTILKLLFAVCLLVYLTLFYFTYNVARQDERVQELTAFERTIFLLLGPIMVIYYTVMAHVDPDQIAHDINEYNKKQK